MSRRPCRVCLRPCAQTRRGRCWSHAARSAHGPLLAARCPGAGLPPAGEPGPQPEPLPGQRREASPLAREAPPWAGGTVYLLHFDRPFSHARHYLGWASPGNLHWRLSHHGGESGANLLWHVAKAGIGWELARTWGGDRHLERRLKNRGGAARLCPVCRPELEPQLLAALR